MKEEIILIELAPETGHANLFINTTRILSTTFKVHALVPSDFKDNSTNFIKTKQPYFNKSMYGNYIIYRLLYSIYCIKRLLYTINYAKKKGVRKVIFLTYDDVSFGLSHYVIPRNMSIYLMHHLTIDSLEGSKFRRELFATYKNKYYHIVQARFMADYLEQKYGLNNVVVWPHPLNKGKSASTIRYTCVGLSNSNDQQLIDRIIEREDKESLFKNNSLHVVLKSSTREYDNGYLKVIKGFLPSDEYDDYISMSKCILVPFPCTFNFRMSGTVVDAFSNNKYVIATKTPLITECNKAYPELIYLFNVNSFIDTLIQINELPNNNFQFDKFREFHSDENLSKIYTCSLQEHNDKIHIRIDF